MEKGKIPYNSLLRSVLREPFIQKEEEHIGRDACISDGIMSVTNTTVYDGPGAVPYAFYRTMNGAWAAGMESPSLQVSLTIPLREKETVLREQMKTLTALCKKEGVRLLGGHTSSSSRVSAPVFTLTAIGKEGAASIRREPCEGDELFVIGYPGDAGAYILLNAEREKLEKRFSGDFLWGVEAFADTLSAKNAVLALNGIEAYIHDISEGGIYSALWEMASGYNLGFSVTQKSIPLHQETVEICELLGGNPYTLLSTGALLASTKDGESLKARLKEAGISAAYIGVCENGSKKKLLRDDEIHYLDRPARDFVMEYEIFG